MKNNFFIAISIFLFLALATLLLQISSAGRTDTLPASDGEVIQFEMRVLQDKWQWEPSQLEAPLGARVRVNIKNEDSYAHGFAIVELGVDKYLPGNKTTQVEFMADKIGEFKFFCSVLCGKGHYHQTGVVVIY